MRLLDLFCGAGGCSVGYHRAGFEVVGVDLHPQPNYPYEFRCGDAIEALDVLCQLRWWDQTSAALSMANEQRILGGYRLADFDAIHASPPCQYFSDMRHLAPDSEHVDLLTPTRELLEQTGLPYVLENVPGATLRKDYLLCGSMFGLGAECADGEYRQLRRHRWFETNWPVGLQPLCAHKGQPVGVYGEGGGGQMTRGYKGNLAESREAMGIPWMSRAEISQAIPPDYTSFIGAELMRHLKSSPTTEGSTHA